MMDMKSSNVVNNSGKYKRKKKRRIKKSTVILLLFMLSYLAYHYINLEMRHQSLIQERDQLRISIQETENYQQHLLEQVEYSKSNQYVERLARKYFGLIYPDEKVYIEKEVDNPD